MSARRPLHLRVQRRLARVFGLLPDAAKRVVAGRPVRLDGQELDVDAQVGIRLLHLTTPRTFEQLPVPEGRAQVDEEAWLFGDPVPVATVEDIELPGADGPVPARLYRPDGLGDAAPGLVWFHGGGWVLGGLDVSDSVCRLLAQRAGVVVVSVDYRLAPEDPFPAGVDDCVAAFAHVRHDARALGIDAARLGVGGESAGGNLAAVVAQQLRGPGGPAFQALFMPVTDLSTKHDSYRLFGDGFFLTEAQMDWYRGHYLTDAAQAQDPRVSPLLTPDLAGLAPAYVVTAGFDPLRDEGEAYAARLAEAGVPVTLRRHAGLTHGQINAVGAGRAARDAVVEAAGVVRALASPSSTLG